MGIILGEAANAHESMEHSRQLMTMHEAHFGQPQWELPIAVESFFINQHGPGAVHRFNGIGGIIDGGEIHVVLVMVPVPRLPPELLGKNNRGFDFLVAPLDVHFPPEVLQEVPQDHALGMEKGKSGAFFVDAKQVKLLPQPPVIPLSCFFQHMQVVGKLLLGGKGNPVDPLQHRAAAVSSPVGTGDVDQFEGFDIAGARQVGPATQINEFPLGVDAHRFVREILNQFLLVHIAPEDLQCLFFAQFLPLEGQVGLDNLLHFLLDPGQIIGRKRLGKVKVVVKPVLNGRANAKAGPGE